jgi:hypothetical protein
LRPQNRIGPQNRATLARETAFSESRAEIAIAAAARRMRIARSR